MYGVVKRETTSRIGDSKFHESAWGHVSGTAQYIDDEREPEGTLHVFIAQSPHAHAKILSMSLDAVAAFPGVDTVVSGNDVPGINDISALHIGDEPVFAQNRVEYMGQPLFAVAASSIDVARKAAKLAEVEYEVLKPILTPDEAIAANSFVLPPRFIKRGDPEAALAKAPHRLQGELKVGGQEHFYLESQISFAFPLDDGGVRVHCATQNPTEVQTQCAQVMGLASHDVEIVVRRMGGGFGGKETQPGQFAAIASLVAGKSGKPAKLRLDRDDDMIITGKRHAFDIEYDVGFDDDGRITGISFVHKLQCGYAADLSGAVSDRGVMNCDNAYYLEHVQVRSYRCKTNTVSNTAFRGFGVPQGVIGIERAILDIAHYLGLDPLDVRKRNFYAKGGRDITHYGQQVSNLIIADIVDKLAQDADYENRRNEIAEFNANSPIIKRGIALTPAMMGIAFTRAQMNQAGSLVHIYKDGSVAFNHGGTEMGQGLHVKLAQIAANGLGVKFESVKVTATTTGKVPNTSPTAASAGIDLNGMAILDAVGKLRKRLTDFAVCHFNLPAESIRFEDGIVYIGAQTLTFKELVWQAYVNRVSLSATGFFKTPHIHFDDASFTGEPFLYFAFGAAISEVSIDTLTGEHRVERIDILHDVGTSINEAIDIGQIEGGFIQGMGWLTTEELCWNDNGKLLTHAPSTYKIPTASDVPTNFNVRLVENRAFKSDTPYMSKAVGEPPLMLSVSVHQALIEAVSVAKSSRTRVSLDAPATPERILFATIDTASTTKSPSTNVSLNTRAKPERVLVAAE